MFLPLFAGLYVGLSFWDAILDVLSSFAIILTRKRELGVLFFLSFERLITVNVL